MVPEDMSTAPLEGSANAPQLTTATDQNQRSLTKGSVIRSMFI